MVQHVSPVARNTGCVMRPLTGVQIVPVFVREGPLLALLRPPDRLEGTDSKTPVRHSGRK